MTAAAAPDDREVGDVLVAIDRVDRYGRERITTDSTKLQAAARTCLDALLPVAARPARGAWVVGLAWSASGKRNAPEVVAERSLIESQPLPDRLAECVLERAPAPELDEGQHQVLLAIRTRSLAVSQGDIRLDDPRRAVEIIASGRVELVTGAVQDLDWLFAREVGLAEGRRVGLDHPLQSDARAAARKCAAQTSPVRDRPLATAWVVSLSWRNPRVAAASGYGLGTRATGPGGGGQWGGRSHDPPPEGFEACMQQALSAPDFLDQVARIELNVEVMTSCYRDEHMYGVIGHGGGSSAGFGRGGGRSLRGGCSKP